MRIDRPRIRTLDADGVRRWSQHLADRVREFEPNAVVGIATGGAEVARTVVSELTGSPALVIVRVQRRGTQIKENRRISAAIRGLPRGVADAARWMEVECREVRHRATERHRAALLATEGDAEPSIDCSALVLVRDCERILVVDDTLDSGDTMRRVVGATRSVSPAASIRTAVLATTWRRPPVRPDYVLGSRLLLRMPTSIDA